MLHKAQINFDEIFNSRAFSFKCGDEMVCRLQQKTPAELASEAAARKWVLSVAGRQEIAASFGDTKA